MLKNFGEEIWISDGAPVVAALGFHYPTRMALIRLADGGLFVWSPTELTDDLRAAISELGPVRHIVAPNSLHHLYVPEWQRAYPDAQTYAAPGLRGKRKDINFDFELSDAPAPAWAGEIDQVVMAGNTITTELVFFHIKSGTVLFTDLIQHFPPKWFSGWRALVARLDLMVAAEPAVPRKFRLAFTNRKAAREGVARVLAWPARKVLMAHGAPVEKDGRAFLARAFLWLTK